jgi:predicted permease
MRGMVFRPMTGVPDATRFLLVEPRADNGSYPGTSWPEFQDLRERLRTMPDLFAFRTQPLNFGQPGHEERVHAQLVSGNYFSALGVRPSLGRWFRPEEASQPGGAPVAVLSYHFWRDRLGAAPDAVGRTIRLNGREIAIIGVAADGFEGSVVGLTFDCWVPATLAPVLLAGSRELEQRESRGYSLMGALASEMNVVKARAELSAAMADLARTHPASNAGVTGAILPFWRAPRGAPQFLLSALTILQGFMLLVLLVVCANTANLLLARATARQREIGVRLALGARPAQVARLFLLESVVLGLLAGGLGGLLAWWGADALRAVPLPGGFPFKINTRLDGFGLVVLGLLSGGAVLLFGLFPALSSARTDAHLALRSSRSTSGQHRVRSTLMALEVALALFVLVVAGMFSRNFLESRLADPGFRTRGVLLAGYDLSGAGYDQAQGLAAMTDLLRRLRATPGVEAAAVASWVPLDFHGMPQAIFALAGRVRPDGGKDQALTYTVTPGYFETIGLKFVAGHDFAALTDTKLPAQVVVNEEFVRRFGENGSMLGREITGKSRNFEIVGVVRNALYESFGEPVKPIIYFSYRDRFSPAGQFHVFTSGPEGALAPDLLGLIRGMNPAITVYDVRTLSEHVDKNLFFRKIPARLFSVIGPLVLLLAAIGIYAVVAFATAQRTSEIGLRLALGASRNQVVRGIVRETLRTICLGVVPAWLIAVVVMIHLRGGILNATILLGAPLLLFTVAAVAAWLPARRAARVDPVLALRAE